MMFEPACRLTAIERGALSVCQLLNCLVIPASVTAIDCSAFEVSGIRSIGIEEGSVSFRVQNGFLLDFEGRSLIWAIGSPVSIVIPASIEELAPSCCRVNLRLKTVAFESDSQLRSIGRLAFEHCHALQAICIPASVQVLRGCCFASCWGLRSVTFDPGSKLQLIENDAFQNCGSLALASVPHSAKIIRRAYDDHGLIYRS
jgi:hypothetical protein